MGHIQSKSVRFSWESAHSKSGMPLNSSECRCFHRPQSLSLSSHRVMPERAFSRLHHRQIHRVLLR